MAIKQSVKPDHILAFMIIQPTWRFHTPSLNKIFRRPILYMLGAVVLCIILGNIMASFFYVGILAIPIAWIIEGTMGAKRFKQETNFKEFAS